jgi:hypothetical protein
VNVNICRNKAETVHCTPKNFDVPPKMKVKRYMYPQMEKPVGMLHIRNSKLIA